jgi:hypothetical protein
MIHWKHSDKVTPRFKTLVEGAIADSKVALALTSDWRDISFVDPGASKTSRHLYGEAVDFDIPRKGHGCLVGPFVVALIRRADAMGCTRELEIELVASAKDSHLHVALDPKQSAPAIFGATD